MAEQLPFDDGALDAVVTTSAFHLFNQPAALREFHRVLASGGLVAVATLSARHSRLQAPSANRWWKPQHNPSSVEMRELFEKRRVRRQRPAPCPSTGEGLDLV